MEYGKIVKKNEIPKCNDKILYEIWNLYRVHKVPDPNLNKKW